MKQLNNNTQEDYVDFEVAKLLKEKGFVRNISTELRYMPDGSTQLHGFYAYSWSRPTIQLAVKWIYENFRIEIDIRCINSYRNDNYEYCIHKDNDVIKTKNAFVTRDEAYQAAIKYTLENLIP